MLGSPLSPGSPAPDFSAVTHDGRIVRLADHRGRPVILVFYPADDTPG
jgi:thioredoxin-dependent peroxiredoxin